MLYTQRRTLQGEHEVVQRVLVQLVSLCIVLFEVLVDRPLYDLDGPLQLSHQRREHMKIEQRTSSEDEDDMAAPERKRKRGVGG